MSVCQMRVDPRIKNMLELVSFFQGRDQFEIVSEILLQPIDVTEEEIAKWQSSRLVVEISDAAADLIREQAWAKGLSMRKLGNAKLAKGLGMLMIREVEEFADRIDSFRASLREWQRIGEEKNEHESKAKRDGS